MTNLSNFDRIGLLYADVEKGIDPEKNPDLTHNEVMGVAKWYNVFTGPNSEQLWFGDDGNGQVLTANPMFGKGSLFKATIDVVLEGQEPFAFFECDVHLSILEDGEVATRMQALMVNLGSRAFEDKKGWFGRTKQVSKPVTMFTGKTIEAEIAIFAHEVTHFATSEDYLTSPNAKLGDGDESQDLTLGPLSFLPSGMFPDEDGQTAPYGLGAGAVKDCGTAKSAFSGPDYHWAVVEAIGGDFGVVWSPLEAGPAIQGGHLSYSGMIVAEWKKIEGLEA